MVIHIFESGLVYGDDRGSIMPVQTYRVVLPETAYSKYLDKVGAAVYKALESVADSPFIYKNTVWVDKYTAVEDSDETAQMLTAHRSVSDPVRVTSNVEQTTRRVVADILASADWADLFQSAEFAFSGSEEFDSIDWAEVFATPVVIQPRQVTIGSRVFFNNAEYTYMGFDPRGRDFISISGNEILVDEAKVVPVNYVENRNYQIEVFPLPTSLKFLPGRWFARNKEDHTVEAFGRLKAEAIKSLKIKMAFKEYWG